MGIFTTALICVLVISFFVFVIFFGRLPAFRGTPIGALHRALWIHLPRTLRAIDQRLTNGRVSSSTKRSFQFLMNERHPTVLVLFILLMFIPEWIFLPAVFPTLGRLTQIAGAITVILPYTFLYLSAFGDPGIITHDNHGYYMLLYPYDHTLFHPGRYCHTCKFLKPARSKHCSTCGVCVAKSDHHCIFINYCVGYGNHHWFLLLLVSTAILTTFGTCLGVQYLLNTIHISYPSFTLRGTGLSWSEYFAFWSWVLAQEPGVGSITLLTFLISPLIWGLSAYHLYLIWAGTTTNESGKWSDLKLDMDDGTIFKRRLSPDRELNPQFEPQTYSSSWPRQSLQITIRTNDGEPPNVENTRILPGEGEWYRVWSLKDIENLYDVGFYKNMADVFCRRPLWG